MPDNITLFLESRKGFYYYYNWTAGQTNKIHWCECGHCNYGSGKRRLTVEGADRFVGKIVNRPVNLCNCID